MTQPQVVDLTQYEYTPQCEMGCGRAGTVVAKGCMDKSPVVMCDECLTRGLEIVDKVVQMHHKLNKRIMVCGDCYRPILTLETHLEVNRIT